MTETCHICNAPAEKRCLVQSWGGVLKEEPICATCWDEYVDEEGEPEPYDPYHEHPWPC